VTPYGIKTSVSDPDSFFTDPDPDPGFFLNPDPDPVPDPDPDPGKEKTFRKAKIQSCGRYRYLGTGAAPLQF